MQEDIQSMVKANNRDAVVTFPDEVLPVLENCLKLFQEIGYAVTLHDARQISPGEFEISVPQKYICLNRILISTQPIGYGDSTSVLINNVLYFPYLKENIGKVNSYIYFNMDKPGNPRGEILIYMPPGYVETHRSHS